MEHAATYILLTAARNEENYIRYTIESVINQTIKPLKWIVVDDGSTDETAQIVSSYAAENDFIELISKDGDLERNFGSKSKAINSAYERIKPLEFDYVGNLDADISFAEDYYEQMLQIMSDMPNLGLGGGMRFDMIKGKPVFIKNALNSVGGPYQFFRRDCFEQIGGFPVLPYGGEDTVLEVSARMWGWQVQSFPALNLIHHKPTDGANKNRLQSAYIRGMRDYLVGYHFLFHLGRVVGRLKTPPYLVWSLVYLFSYTWAWLSGVERPVSDKLVAFLQNEQLLRLKIRRGDVPSK